MGWRLVVQPNLLLARFSEIVDGFTHLNMSESEAIQCCLDEGLDRSGAAGKISRAKENPDRWIEDMKIIKNLHGEDEAMSVEAEVFGFNKDESWYDHSASMRIEK